MAPMVSFNKTVTVSSELLSAAPAWRISAPTTAPPARALEIFFSALRREMPGDFMCDTRVVEFSQTTVSRANLQEDAIRGFFVNSVLYRGNFMQYDAPDLGSWRSFKGAHHDGKSQNPP